MKTIEQMNKLIKDPIFRANLINDASAYAPQLGYANIKGVDFKVVTNTKSTFHYVIPDYNAEIDIQQLQAGVKASTAGTVGSASTASTITGTIGSLGTAATLGSLAE